jgi:hypothetical protein
MKRYLRNKMVQSLAGGSFEYALKLSSHDSHLIEFYFWLKKRSDWFSIR